MCRRGTRREPDGDGTFSSSSWTARNTAGSRPSRGCSWVWVCVVGERREHGGEESELGSGELSPMFFGQNGGWSRLGACWLVRRGGGEGTERWVVWMAWSNQ